MVPLTALAALLLANVGALAAVVLTALALAALALASEVWPAPVLARAALAAEFFVSGPPLKTSGTALAVVVVAAAPTEDFITCVEEAAPVAWVVPPAIEFFTVMAVKVLVIALVFGFWRMFAWRVLPVPESVPISRPEAKKRYSPVSVIAGAAHVTVDALMFAVRFPVPATAVPWSAALVSSLAPEPLAFVEANTRQLALTVMPVGIAATNERNTIENVQLAAANEPVSAFGLLKPLPLVPVMRLVGSRVPEALQPVRG